ncbi:MAG: tRNA lysidine(34) synthetase TilS [Planctomycetota bacterium]
MHPLPEGRILLAFSGGPDSIGLAARLRRQDPLLAYVDHRMRGAREARRERARVRELARALGLDLVRTRVTVARGGEAAARRERYRVLHALARKHGSAAVATAHTADDRAETILLNLLRGTGLRGLAAPRPRTLVGGVVRLRPALDERRADLHAAGAAHAPASVVDATNRRTNGARARARALLLPRLASILGEDPVPLLCGVGDLAAALREVLEERAAGLASWAGRRAMLGESAATFPYLVEALRRASPPLTSRAYGALRDFLRAGRRGRTHVTPGGEGWRIERDGAVRVTPPSPP